MRLPDFQYLEPKTIEEASLFLKEHAQECKVMGGGTDLLPSLKQRIFKPKYLVNLCAIPNLDRIEWDERTGLRIGPSVKLRSLETGPLIGVNYPMIAKAASEVGSVQLRQMGTVGGNLCLDTRCYYYNQSDFWRKCRPTCIKMGGERCNAIEGGKKCFAVFSGDLAPALIALGAKIKLLSSRRERTLLLRDFYTGNGAKPLAVEPDEIMVALEIPPLPKESFGIYLKYRIRGSIDFPIASVAALLTVEGKEKVCRDVGIVIGAVGARPEEIKGVQELLLGKRLEPSLIEEASDLGFKAARPIDNAASSASYRKRMIKIFVKKALTEARDRSA
jgi:4-hydroxybenzoyl-CoA reductase subunit beta